MEAVTVPSVCAPRRSALHAVKDQLQISTARLNAMAMGRSHGLAADAVDRLATVVTALAENIARHAESGHIIVRPVGDHATGCIEILALDKGPGIADMTRVMRDGSSPSDPARRESGLASIRRLSDFFDIYAHAGRGTAVVAHIGAQTGKDSTCGCAESVMHGCVGVVCVPLHGEEACGDAWAVDVSPSRTAALLIDGLGHGPGAAAASLAALSTFSDAVAESPEAMMASMHTALRETRGAALSVTVVDHARRTARFCGVGNVDGRIVTVGSNQHLIPQNGIVGHNLPRVIATDVPWPTDGRLVMHSDGISSRWRADNYPGLLARHPSLLAGVLFRDFARARDDATVLVLRGPLPATAE